ncbi:TMEM165/GDT1 family protein [Sphingomonas silueang]|uniref:TMEM165/GDT1 family protein n=1 Tax=Sphingomonas silueang TaxID=3156617 RepID=UPI0032B4A894
MDPLVPAFVAVLLAGCTDRPALLAAVLADRHGAQAVWPGAVLALAAGFALSAVGGVVIAPHLTPNARGLLLALGLLSAGGAALWPPRGFDRLEGWRLPGALKALFGTLILMLGDRSQFLVFALVARNPEPWLGAIGGTLAGAVPVVAATLLGERSWTRLPRRAIGIVAGSLLLVVGAVTGLGALRLL